MLTMTESVNQAGSVRPLELKFRATRERPRRLSVELDQYGRMYVYVWPPGKQYITLASASQKLREQHECGPSLHAYDEPFLVVAGAYFKLTVAEAAEVERVFAPLGLTVHRKESRS